jgi:diadenosine tetraphosphate (Ap4A) HIT family hydrolase
MNSSLPGYLMLGSKAFADELSDLSMEALSSLGPLMAKVQSAMRIMLRPDRIYIGRYGHRQGYPLHFHMIPIYDWVERLFWQDTRYRALEDFAGPVVETAVDGAELTFFVWREFCERLDPPAVQGPTVAETIAILREAMRSPEEDREERSA